MSMIGWEQIELERERREQIRREQDRTRANALAVSCETTITAVKDPAVQQSAAKDLKQVRGELQSARPLIDSAPERALADIRRIQQRLHEVIAEAEAAAGRWRKEQVAGQARLQALESRLEAERKATNLAGESVLAEAEDRLRKAQALHYSGREEPASDACNEANELIEQAKQAALDESIRREVVRGLLTTLTGMGFVVEGPQLVNQDEAGGIVTLVGTLPSGKLARFEVSVDGKMRFDLDGYEGRSCAKEMQRVEQRLKEQFGIRFGPQQITWKNPNRISKGARDLPSGGRAASR